jgi:acyl carrier protein
MDALISFRTRAYDRIHGNIENKTGKMLQIYANTKGPDGPRRCGYFDPTTTYGGPQESPPELNDKKKDARKDYLQNKNDEDSRGARHLLENELGIDSNSADRSIIHERTILARIEDYSHVREHLAELEEWFRINVDDYYLDQLEIEEIQDILEFETNQSLERHRRDAKKGKGKKQRLEAGDPLKDWKTITTGYRKWAERYIAYCNKQYVERRFSRWAFEHLWKKIPMVYKKMKGQEQ